MCWERFQATGVKTSRLEGGVGLLGVLGHAAQAGHQANPLVHGRQYTWLVHLYHGKLYANPSTG